MVACYNSRVPTDPERLSDIACFRCGECCRRYQVLLERAEVQRLADHLRISPDEFIEQYADPRWPGTDKHLMRQVEGNCPFLRGGDREFLCAVHEMKPRPCREWAAALSRPECRRGLENYWQLTVNSAGEVQGAPENIQSFRDFLTSCEKGEPG